MNSRLLGATIADIDTASRRRTVLKFGRRRILQACLLRRDGGERDAPWRTAGRGGGVAGVTGVEEMGSEAEPCRDRGGARRAPAPRNMTSRATQWLSCTLAGLGGAGR